MNILFIEGGYSEDRVEYFRNHSKWGFQYSIQTFQNALLSGFAANNQIFTVVAKPNLSSFPNGYTRPFVPTFDFIHEGKKVGKSLGFINVPFLRSVSKRAFMKCIDNWHQESGVKVILIYNLSSVFMKLAFEARKNYPDIKICIIVLDLPFYMRANRLYEMLGLRKKSIDYIKTHIPDIDGFIYLTEPMVSILGQSNKPYTIVEGMYQPSEQLYNIKKTKKKSVLYSGALVGQYGITDLLDAFELINEDDCELWLCGDGDCVPRINEMQARKNNIKYYGVLSTNETRLLQKKAHLLINPRHSSEEFTKYSFPSKTMEYMASGTPTLMTHLECLRPEYLPHLFIIEDESPEGIKNKIMEILSYEESYLNKFGQEASEFVIREKSAIVQTRKIIDFLKQNFSFDNSIGCS